MIVIIKSPNIIIAAFYFFFTMEKDLLLLKAGNIKIDNILWINGFLNYFILNLKNKDKNKIIAKLFSLKNIFYLYFLRLGIILKSCISDIISYLILVQMIGFWCLFTNNNNKNIVKC